MSEKYKIRDQDEQYFITFATVGWIDVFTRQDYVTILLKSIKYCQQEKGLEIYGWCIMSNHVHMIIGKTGNYKLEEIIRDLKKYTSRQIVKAIAENTHESRKEWMLRLFMEYGSKTGKHKQYMFWQNEYHPVALITIDIAMQKLDYMHMNPVVNGIVNEPSDYRYSSAMDYEKNRTGLIEITFLY